MPGKFQKGQSHVQDTPLGDSNHEDIHAQREIIQGPLPIGAFLLRLNVLRPTTAESSLVVRLHNDIRFANPCRYLGPACPNRAYGPLLVPKIISPQRWINFTVNPHSPTHLENTNPYIQNEPDTVWKTSAVFNIPYSQRAALISALTDFPQIMGTSTHCSAGLTESNLTALPSPHNDIHLLTFATKAPPKQKGQKMGLGEFLTDTSTRYPTP